MTDAPFHYAIVRVVPRVDRGECINAGIIVFARTLDYLEARTTLDEELLAAVSPDTDPGTVRAHLQAFERIAAGDPAAGPMAQLSQSERFHWLVAPASTIIQTSATHLGVCDDPAAQLEQLFGSLVAR